MATKSFSTEFKFSARSCYKLLDAIENSKKVDIKTSPKTNNIISKKDINKLLDLFLEDN